MSRYIDADEIKRQWEIYGSLDVMDRILADVFPTVDAVPVVHGHWILEEKRKGFPDWKCSICGGSGRGDHIFCEWCSASMDEVTE